MYNTQQLLLKSLHVWTAAERMGEEEGEIETPKTSTSSTSSHFKEEQKSYIM